MVDVILEILNKIEPILLVLIPAVFGVYVRLKNRYRVISEAESRKLKDTYDKWKHDRSRVTIINVKEACNVYKDKSDADQVFFLQLENGSVATSKLNNMFFSCLAEDDRYSSIPKKQLKLQRIPYSQFAEWFEESAIKTYFKLDIRHAEESWLTSIAFADANSVISSAVRDKEGCGIGMVVFEYKKSNLDPSFVDSQIELIKEFKVAVEMTFLGFFVECKEKQTELRVSEEI